MLGDLYIHSGKYDLAQVSPWHDGLVGCFLIALSLRPPGSMQKVLDAQSELWEGVGVFGARDGERAGRHTLICSNFPGE